MKKDTRRKISWIAFLLAAWMTVSAIPATALGSFGEGIALAPEQESAALEDEVLGSDEALTVEETELSLLPTLGEGEKTVAELSAMEVNAADIPEVIPMSRAQEKGLVNRLRAQEESLSTLVYQTKSGNKTAYVYSRPVKYVAADGSIRDKSTAVSALTNATYAYAMEDNSVKAYFPKSITGGVLLAYNDYRITMTPEVTGDYTPLYNEEEKAVVYAGVFGEATFLTYKPQMYGLKEDVILAKNPGVNRFDFVMTTQGLTAQKGVDGIWRLYNSQDEAVAGLGQVIVKDSAGKTAMGELEVTLLSANRYRVSVVAPQEFLNASDTFYPVYVDPTTTVYERENREFYDEEGDFSDAVFDTIIDVGLYETHTGFTSALANTGTHYLGYKNGGYGKVIYKFYDFYGEHGYFTDLYAEQIGKVTLHIYAYDGDGIDLIASPMTATWETQYEGENPIAFWDPDEINLWNSYHSASSVSYSIPEADGWYGLDITSIVRGWARYNAGESTASYHNPQNGFALSTGTTSNYMGIYSVESNEFAVCYEVVYALYSPSYYIGMSNNNVSQYLQNYYDGEESNIKLDSFLNSEVTEKQWVFQFLGEDSFGNPYFNILNKYTNRYICCYGTSVDYGIMTDTNKTRCTWKLVYNAGNYYLQSAYNDYYLYHSNGVLCVSANKIGDSTAFVSLVAVMPLSGYELDYNASLWSGIAQYCNCYGYALNNQLCLPYNVVWERQQPGEYAAGEYVISSLDFYAPATAIIQAVKNDFAAYNEEYGTTLLFTEIDKYDVCPDGSYKVALVIAPGTDYHWYRQDSDGLWSHKPGITPLTRFDESDEYILDPEVADRGEYTQFIGYFAVTPWNQYYSGSLQSAQVLEMNPMQSDSTSTEQTFVVDPQRITEIQIGMSIEQVEALLGIPGVEIGRGAIVFEYAVDESNKVIVHYYKKNNQLYVSSIQGCQGGLQ